MMPRSRIQLLLVLLLLTLLIAAGGYWAMYRSTGISFVDVASHAGLTVVTDNRAEGRYRVIETMGTGLAMIDYDTDGWLDIVIGQGGELPGDDEQSYPGCRLYRNNRDGTFTDVTERSGLVFTAFAQGFAAGDFDADGYDDLFIAGFGRCGLFRNTGRGGFEDVTQSAGVAGSGWATSCAFADLNANGFLDLYVVRYLADTIDEFGMASVQCPTHLPKVVSQLGYCPPTAHAPQADLLYRNNGDGTFTDVSESSGLHTAPAPGLGVLIADLNGDRRLDVYIANDMTPNQLWRNAGDLKFDEVAAISGVAVGARGESGAGMGIAAGDYNGTGNLDMLVTNFQDEANALYQQTSPGLFEVATAKAGLEAPSVNVLGFGTGFFDADNDGHLDLFVSNGHINDFSLIGKPFKQAPQLFRNTGMGTFEDVSSRSGPYFRETWLGRSVALGDVDNDGATDVLVSHLGRNPALLMNTTRPRGHFLGLLLRSNSASRSPVGTSVTVRLQDRQIWGSVHAGSSYLASHDPRLLFGLGTADRADDVEILWANGAKQQIGPLVADTYYLVEENHPPQRLDFGVGVSGDRAVP